MENNIRSVLTNLDDLVFRRALFEIEVYDYLVDPFLGIPESFWEPVRVSFENVKDLEDHISKDTCYICSESHLNFKKMSCCNQKMCNGCCYSWFEKSVNCPYCYQDLRKFDLKNKKLINENE